MKENESRMNKKPWFCFQLAITLTLSEFKTYLGCNDKRQIKNIFVIF